MASVPSSNVTRLYASAGGAQVSLFRIIGASTSDTWDTTTVFYQAIKGAEGIILMTTQVGSLSTEGSTFVTSLPLTTMNGLTTVHSLYAVVVGVPR